MQKLGHQSDYSLIIIFGIIVVFGLVMLSSATSVIGYSKFQDSYWYLKHQLLSGFLPGLVLFFLLSKIDYQRWKKFSFLFLILSVVLLCLVFVPGIGADYGTDSRSWLNIFGFSIQPAEIVKLTFILYLAAWLNKRKERVQSFAYGFVPFLIYVGLVAGLIIAQPDIGTLGIILMISFIIFFTAGAKIKHLLLAFLGGLGGMAILIKIAPYRLHRLTAFLNPEDDPLGIGYHINQALLAIGSGGWLGVGLGHSRQKFQYLPEVAGDSIFAVMAEELGFVVTLLLIILFILLFAKMIKIADHAPDFFGHLVAVGVATWIAGQFFINIGAMMGLLPLTGLPLPLVSYGGTAMMMAMAGMGVVVNISKYTIK